MRRACAILLALGPFFLSAHEPKIVPGATRTDPHYSTVDAAFHARFKDATVLKVERKERLRPTVSDILMLFPGKNEVIYALTASDALNKKFEVIFDADAHLISIDKYKAVVESLPASVQEAIVLQAPTARTSLEALDAKMERNLYKVSGKIDGQKINVEVQMTATDLSTLAQSASTAPTTPPAISADKPDANTLPEHVPLRKSGKPEIAAGVDGPFRALFKDATIISVDRKELSSVSVNVFSFGGGSTKYEITLSDPLNKRFKVIFSESGRLFAATDYTAPFDNLPLDVQDAILKMTPIADRAVALQIRVDHKRYFSAEREVYKIRGKINDVTINIDVPIHGGP